MEINQKNNGFYIGNIENPDAEIIYIEDENITITHTYVRNNLRGQGIAKQLLNKTVNYARKKNKKIVPLCSYAIKILNQDVYKDIIL
ncbi:MAG: GNAT family N-acetyltransferase [Bacilli bacterium]|nr:GNAT family N-acetyltransferase [Bacilli bacterium]